VTDTPRCGSSAAAGPVNVVYDSIGTTYNITRHADPRLEQVIWSALGDCSSVLNVGAGTGAYEPADRTVVAVEPSATMRRARPDGSAPCVAAPAESLPFDDRSFDAAMAILTVHHWTDYRVGLRELRRVARRCVLLVHWDQAAIEQFWLSDYFPEAFAFDRRRGPALGDVCATVDLDTDVVPLLVPHDCQDGFGAACWRRPDAYLDPTVRAGSPCWPRPKTNTERAGAPATGLERRHVGCPAPRPAGPDRTRLWLPPCRRTDITVCRTNSRASALHRHPAHGLPAGAVQHDLR
jgi:hypothetical protein